jgi:hypothetical protein
MFDVEYSICQVGLINSTAQKITREMEEEALEFFLTVLEKLPDPRRAQGTRYPLPTVVFTALMAMVRIRTINLPLYFQAITNTRPLPSPPTSLPAVQPG